MKKILFISQYLNRAGTEAFMMSVFRGIDHSRFQTDFLLYTQKETDYSREVEAAGGKVWRVVCRRESPIGWYRELYKFFSHHASEYSAIHFNGNGLTAIAPIVLAFIYKIPIRITHAHNSSSKGLHNRILHKLQRGLSRRLTTHHFACSSEAAKWFYGNSNATIIKNGIDISKFKFSPEVREHVREQLGVKPTTTVMGHVGRFQAEKNHTFIVDVFKEYCKLHEDSILLLIGDGDLMESTRQKIHQVGLADKVRLLGERTDVNLLLQAFDLFLMPSTFEGQPFVLIEAQCCGLPCLVSDVINADICLTDNVSRYSLNRSAREWAKKVEEILSKYERKDESETIRSEGYSAADTITYLEQVYNGK